MKKDFFFFLKKISAACYFLAALHYDYGIFDPTISIRTQFTNLIKAYKR